MKTLIIGDIHGCYDELQALLDAAGLSSDDQIVALGDLVNRGPYPDRVLRFFQKNKHRSLMGNHEYKNIRAFDGESEPTLSQLLTRWQLGSYYAEAVDFMRKFPSYLKLNDALIVHAYLEPDVRLKKQKKRILLGTRKAVHYLESNYENPWYTYYDSKKPLIVGHKDYSGEQQPFVYEDRVFGLDTGCVYGGQLTGLLLPDFRFICVPARETYWQNYLAHYSEN